MDIFDNLREISNKFFESHKRYLVYCDYIAHLISKELKANDSERLLSSVSKPRADLTPQGAMRSTKRTIEVEDRFGKKYRITVTEAR